MHVHAAHDHDSTPVAMRVKLLTLAAVVLPPIALVAAMWLAWGGWFGWTFLVMLVVGYMLTAMGITIGYHRLYTHKSFEASPAVAWTFGILGSMAVQGPLMWWATTHRRHHQHSDHAEDPHSPHAGREPGVVGWLKSFAHAHIGCVGKALQNLCGDRMNRILIHVGLRSVFVRCAGALTLRSGVLGGGAGRSGRRKFLTQRSSVLINARRRAELGSVPLGDPGQSGYLDGLLAH